MSSLVPSSFGSNDGSSATLIPEIDEAIEASFRESSYSALKNIACDLEDGVLTLRGEVPSHFLKQMAQTLAMQAAGEAPVTNRIRVAPRLNILCGRSR